jgi:CheY-like chemotaxis protein
MPSKLLVADDSVTIQRVIELTFADEDVQVIAVGDGEQAVQRIESERPDIVLADVSMPERDGYDVATFVKSSPHLSHIPVVLLTGAFEPVDEARARGAGCDGVLAKPFEPQAVINRVRDLLSGKRQPPPAREPARSEAPPRDATPAEDAALPPGARQATIFQARDTREVSLDDYFDRLDAEFANVASALPDEPARREAPPRAAAPDEAVQIIDPDAWLGGQRSESAPPRAPAPAPVVEHNATPPTDLSWGIAEAAMFPPPAEPAVTPVPEADLAARLEPFAAAPPRQEAAAEPAPQAPRPPLEPVRPEPIRSEPPLVEPALLPVRPAGTGTILEAPPLADAFEVLLAAECGEAPPQPDFFASPIERLASSDEFVDQVTRRVLERLSERITRDVVTDVVLSVADRLVRQELDRMKAEP